MTVPFKVKALFEYSSPHEDDLQFPVGQIITVTEEEDDDWYAGEYVDDSGAKLEGIFPRNFVEKYEPTAPPRPTRTRPKKEAEGAFVSSPPPPPPTDPAPSTAEPALASPRQAKNTQEATAQDLEDDEQAVPEPVKPRASASLASTALAPASAPAAKPSEPIPVASQTPPTTKAPESPAVSPPAAKTIPAAPKPSGPPPVSGKPTGNAFRDRIAAFNKAAAPPIAPFKPAGLGAGSAGFVKKPFVAPPPSRNAYVPPPRDVPTAKVYRRDEDPEIKEREQENLENAEKARLLPTSSQEGEGDDQPKPMSLKERMALLQKQQQEQAQRHAEAATKKEKPKRPPKKRMESHDGGEEGETPLAVPPTPLERRDSEETAVRRSVDEPHASRIAHPGRRKSSLKGLNEPHDGNEADMSGAGDTTEGQEDITERDDSDERPRNAPRAHGSSSLAASAKSPEEDDQEAQDDEDDEEDEEEVDPEVRRKEELRARMAKMSGGMGMAGMFGMPMPGTSAAAPKKKKANPASIEKRSSEAPEVIPSPGFQAPPIPTMMALPGMSIKRPEDKNSVQEEPPSLPPAEAHDNGDEDEAPPRSAPQPNAAPSRGVTGPPPVPGGRPAPPPVPAESRPPPPLPPVPSLKSPSAGSESDDELSEQAPQEPMVTPRGSDAPTAARAPPPPPPAAAPPPLSPVAPGSPTSRQQPFSGEETPPISPTAASNAALSNKRASRVPPPIPAFPPAPPPAQTRPPPPPPPGVLSRQSTADEKHHTAQTQTAGFSRQEDSADEEEITEYEGDYDTDIASSVPHKDALKSHGRESSLEDTTSMSSPVTAAAPLSLPPPLPSVSAPRGPPPIPTQFPPDPRAMDNRRSVDMPRAAPPPPPPPKETPQYDDDYDPYNYSSPSQGVPIPGMSAAPPASSYAPPLPPAPTLKSPETTYSTPEPPAAPQFQASPPQSRAPPPAPPSNRAPPRPSQDMQRSAGPGRRSMDVSRPSMESGFVANDIDLAPQSGWWLQVKGLPPQLQGRKDIFFEAEESQTAQRGKTVVTRDIYILYQDYSQTVITVNFDPQNSSDVRIDQRHEPPPRTLRQDQLEQSYERFGRQIAAAVAGKKDLVVGDGTPQALVYDLLRPLGDALLPVGTRAYGALVYSNLANASTTQNDEIRPGDIISIRNAKFQGKHGAMHQKYSVEIGKPDHVAVVAEWDGTKKKVKAWEQGRESKKVKLESFKLDDLRSGEVKIWRVMPRSWVGWEGQN